MSGSKAARGDVRGFSMVELLVTIVLAGIVFAAMVPLFVNASKKGFGRYDLSRHQQGGHVVGLKYRRGVAGNGRLAAGKDDIAKKHYQCLIYVPLAKQANASGVIQPD